MGAVAAALFASPLAASAGARHPLAYTGGLWQGLIARCGAVAAADEPYPWPLRPFHQQHPVRAFFGDPRNLVSDVDQPLTPQSPGTFSFHNGIDIYAAPDEKVFPWSRGGRGSQMPRRSWCTPATGETSSTGTSHPLVRTGRWVTASKTVLGTAIPRRGHLHLTEMRGTCAVNPLAAGHLEPYVNATQPEIVALSAVDPEGAVLDPTQLAGPFGLVVQAQDQPPFPVPPPWENLPVTPAAVKWRLTGASGRVVVPWTFAADFAVTIPPNRDYWRVYADGSHQNFVGRGALPQLPGTYTFRLTPPSSVLAPGRYTVSVAVFTTGGSRSTQQLPFTVVPSSAG